MNQATGFVVRSAKRLNHIWRGISECADSIDPSEDHDSFSIQTYSEPLAD
jgi:hypothetical protein